ncbi:MAG TPA: DUF4398 domain-containing protein, partial [Steroidobacteraceae bacterium]
MNNSKNFPIRSMIAVAVATALIAGCASAPMKPAGSAEVRAKLTALQSDPSLANSAPVAMKDAETAVTVAEMVQKDLALAAHRVYIANRKVDTARALAQTQTAETERKALTEAGEKARLNARTLEADKAKNDALVARAESAEQKLIAGQARENADASQLAANASQQQALELQRQL